MKKTTIILLSLLLGFNAFAQDTLFVKDSETSTAWAGRTAYTNLQDAIDAAQAGDQIWVAQGTYYPTTTFGNNSDVRCKSFVLKDNISLYGGFVGTESSIDDRVLGLDWDPYPTFLSGDFASTPDVASDNSYHVVYGRNTSAVTLDGFTISGGYANRTNYLNDQDGAGVYMGDNWILRNCKLEDNTAMRNGAGVWVSATGSLNDCYLHNNAVTSVSSGGGGAYFDNRNSYNSIVAAVNCFFEGNQCMATQTLVGSNRYGGGAMNSGQNAIFEECVFIGNSSTNPGGAVICSNGNTFSNCMFYLNQGTSGAAIYAGSSSSLRISNCLFSNNAATANGGALYATGSTCCTINSTLVNNIAANGAAIYGSSSFTLFNSIVWNNGEVAEDQVSGSSDVTCLFTAIQGVLASGDGNLNVTTEDIAFTDPCSIIGLPAGDDIQDQLELILDAEYTIENHSLCKDAGDLNIIYLSGYQFPDEDLNGDDRVVGTAIDLGCYENLCANIAPTFTWTVVDTTFNEEEPGTGTVSIEFTVTNYDEDFDYSLDFGAGFPITMENGTLTVAFNFPGSHTITISYTDGDCGAETDTTIVLDSLFSPVGILENEDQTLSFFPNPVHNSLTVESESPISGIAIYDLTGREAAVRANNDSPQRWILNTSSLPAGVYFLKVVTDNGTKTAKFVKQ